MGFTCGTYDLLHAGHILSLEATSHQCDHLIVGLQSDPTIDRPNKNKPVQSIRERHIQLSGCKYVGEIWHYTTEQELYNYLKENKRGISKRFLGEDWVGKEFTGKDLPIPVFFNSRKHTYSSSELRDRIINSL